VALRRVREDEARAAGRPVARVATGVAAEVGLARRESPHRASILLGLATVLDTELPHTMAALRAGRITEWRATLIARETACVSRTDRRRVDTELSHRLETMSDRQTAAEARKLAYRLDPHSVVERQARAETDRRVTIRPAPDCMAQLSILLPAAQGVAAYAALAREADNRRATGDERSRTQLMADTAVTRITGQQTPTAIDVAIQLVMTDHALLDDSPTPARLDGYGPIPAHTARRLIANSHNAWIRRLYTKPTDGRLVAMETRQRLFPQSMKNFIVARDETCRTPWCNAPIRHADHIIPARLGGATNLNNGQGLCERCNHTKEHPRWQARPGPDDTIITTTPTGHQYVSTPPTLPVDPVRPQIVIDLTFAA
jgi:hypothetical protein